jgi:hypothetical protein
MRPTRPNSGLGASGDKSKGNGKGTGSKSSADTLPWRRSLTSEDAPSEQASPGAGGSSMELSSPEPAASGENGQARAKDEVNAEIRNIVETPGCALHPTDFDARVRQHLHAILGSGGRQRLRDACTMIRTSTLNKERQAVRNWPAYLLTLLKKFDEQVGWKDREARARARVAAAAAEKAKEEKAVGAAGADAEGTTLPFANRRVPEKAEPPAWWEASPDLEVFPGEEPVAPTRSGLRASQEVTLRAQAQTPEKPPLSLRQQHLSPAPLERTSVPPVPPPPSAAALAAVTVALPGPTVPAGGRPGGEKPPMPPPSRPPEPQENGRIRVPVTPPPSAPPCVPQSRPPSAPPSAPPPTMPPVPPPPGNLIPRMPGTLIGEGVSAGVPRGPPGHGMPLHPPPGVTAPALTKLPPGIVGPPPANAPAARHRPHGILAPPPATAPSGNSAEGPTPQVLNFPLEAWAAWLGQPAVRPIAAR